MAPIIVTDKGTLTLAHEFYREVKTYKADGLDVSQALEIVKMGKIAARASLALLRLLTITVFNNKKFVADFQPGSGSSSDEAVSTSEEQTSDESSYDDESNVETSVMASVMKRANTPADAATATIAPATPPKFGVVSSLTPGKVELSPAKNSAQLFDYGTISYPKTPCPLLTFS